MIEFGLYLPRTETFFRILQSYVVSLVKSMEVTLRELRRIAEIEQFSILDKYNQDSILIIKVWEKVCSLWI